jgi:hypothetical protein
LFGCAAEDHVSQQSQAVTVTLQPDGAAGKDGRAFSLHPDAPAPNVSLIYAMAWTFSGDPGTVRSFLDFDIPAPPPGVPLVRATLTLFAETTISPGGHSRLSGSNELIVRQITSPWDEATVSWNHQPSADPLTQIVLPPSTSPSQTYNIDVTQFMNRELGAPGQFHGFMFQLQTEQFYRAVIFGSSDNANPALRPRLVLEYADVPVGQIRGVVRRYQEPGLGPPVAGATVDAGNGHSAVTNANGEFDISGVPLGTYTLRASLAGWTFGSRALQDTSYTVTLSQPGQPVQAPTIIGYDRDPLVFVHGWRDRPDEFARPRGALQRSGTRVFSGDLETSLAWTPPLAVNAQRVRSWIQDAKLITGRQKVILYGHSMGGLVARSYLEGGHYQGDVSQIFTAGTPHLGIPALTHIGCHPNQPAVCEMTAPGMALFNLVHWKRHGVDYHEIGGDAPMWRQQQICVRIFRRRFCISIPVPSFEYRDAGFWAMGLLIPGKDDGFIRTYSTLGQIGANIDRFMTQEVHDGSHRDYHSWDSPIDGCPSTGESCQAFGQCVRRILIDRNTTTCGSRNGIGPPLSSFFAPSGSTALEPGPAPDGITANPQLTHSTRRGEGTLLAGQRVERTVLIEGGATTFSASWQAGTASFSLIDPTGLVIDAAYAASISDPYDPAQDTLGDSLPPETVVHSSGAGSSIFHVPAARPGAWRLVLEGNADVPATGTPYFTGAGFDSTLAVALQLGRSSQAIGQPLELALRLSEPIASGTAQVSILRDGGVLEMVQLTRRDPTLYTATWTVPGPAGYLVLDWSLTGERTNGRVFERAGRESLMVRSAELTLGSGHVDRAIARPGLAGLNQALAVDLRVVSRYANAELGVAAELHALDGTVVSRTITSVPAALGTNIVELRFPGDDIYLSRVDGPYRVANVRLLDQRGAMLLAEEIAVAHTTAAYSFRSFAPSVSAPSVSLDGPYRVAAGATISLSAIGVDPNGDPLTYRWDLDGDGTYEAQGATLSFTAPASGPAGIRTIRVRVSDPDNNTADADTTLEIFIPAITNIARGAQASARSSQPGHPVSRVNDGDRGSSDGSSASWVNGIADRCTGRASTTPDCGRGPGPRDLPTWVELDFGALRTLRGVEIYLSGSQPVSDYEVQIDDGGGWRSVASVTGNTADRRVHDLPDLAATRLRLWLSRGSRNGPDFVRINEIEVRGY